MSIVKGFGSEFIPSIIGTSFEAEYFGDEDDFIQVTKTNDHAREYPFRILDLHQIVNNVVEGTSVVATYCPDCGSTAAYERRKGGYTLKFEEGSE